MGVHELRAFFMWCTILNAALLILSSVICIGARDWVYRVHSKMFPMSRDAFNVAIYSFLGLFKMAFFVFNLVPYLALLIVG